MTKGFFKTVVYATIESFEGFFIITDYAPSWLWL